MNPKELFEKYPDEPIEIECSHPVIMIGGDGTIYLRIHQTDLSYALKSNLSFKDFIKYTEMEDKK
jgi:hypothetical protein